MFLKCRLCGKVCCLEEVLKKHMEGPHSECKITIILMWKLISHRNELNKMVLPSYLLY